MMEITSVITLLQMISLASLSANLPQSSGLTMVDFTRGKMILMLHRHVRILTSLVNKNS